MRKPLMLAACLLASQAVFAEDDSTDDNATLSVVVTPTRTAQSADATLSAVAVITRDDIEQSGALSLPELLQGQAGLSVSSNGGPGQVSSVFIRGTESDHVLVLVDGIKIGSATLGTTPLHTLPLDRIERIEIVRGPNSALYGSEAIGGVIQIFTRKGARRFTPSVTVGLGSYRTASATINIAGGGDTAWFNLGLDTLTTEGFNVCDVSGAGGCFTSEPDNDGHNTATASARGGYRFGANSFIDAHWQQTLSHTEYDGGFQNESTTLQDIAGVELKFAPLSPWHVDLKTGRSIDKSDNYLNGTYTGHFNTVRDTASMQHDFIVGTSHVLTAGIDHQQDTVDSNTAYVETARHDTGVFGQYQGQFGKGNLQLSARNARNSQFGYHATGNAAFGLRFNDEIRIRASIGTGYKAPTFNELYWPGFGNPALQPEDSLTQEIGMHRKTDMCESNLSLYYTRITNLIALDATFTPQNIADSAIWGFEWSMRHKLGKSWQLGAELNLMEPRNLSTGANNGNLLPRRAQQTLKLDLAHRFGQDQRSRFGLEWLMVGKRFDDLANTVELAPYHLINLSGEYRLRKNLTLQVKLDNLFNEHYETARYYHQPGHSLYFNFRFVPDR